MDVEADGFLFFLLFIPLLWTLWIWVHLVCTCSLTCVLTRAVDDRLEARHYLLRVANILQLPSDVLLCQCRRIPGEMESRTMYVSPLPLLANADVS